MPIKRCGNCGSQKLKTANQKDKCFPWKDFPSIRLLVDLQLLQCQKCGETPMSGKQAKELDSAIEKSIMLSFNKFLDSVVSKHEVMQKEVALRMGITPEYLSQLKAGSKLPSFQTYNFLKTMALSEKGFEVAGTDFDDYEDKVG